MAFQTQVNYQPAPAVEGDWASANPHGSMLAGPGALIAGPAGVTIGRFAWATPAGVVTNTNPGVAGSRLGFVQRDQLALILPYLGASAFTVPAGYEITLLDAGDVWARFAGGATIGQKVFVNLADGSCSAAAAGSASNGATITASITGTTLVATSVTGTILLGQNVTGSGVAAGTTVLTGPSNGGAGTYTVSNSQTIASESMTLTAGLETKFYVDSTAGNNELAMITHRSAT